MREIQMVIVMFVINDIAGSPVSSTKDMKGMKSFLSRYGYSKGFSASSKDVTEGIKNFQYFAGLLVTGELDPPTLNLVKRKRCDVKDPDVSAGRKSRGGRVRRYNAQGTKWHKKVLTWRYVHDTNAKNVRYFSRLTRTQVRMVLYQAISKWEIHTNIRFRESMDGSCDRNGDRGCRNPPDVWFRFLSGRHGDPFPFDNMGGTLAHAFYPLQNVGIAGDVHFDDDERFTINGRSNGRDLLWVATHELGHTLGLDHSGVRDAVMFPFYMGYVPGMRLKPDDIRGIQSIYGAKRGRKPRPTRKPRTRAPDHKVCPSSAVTAVWDYKRDGSYFVITKQEKLYTVSRRGRGIIDTKLVREDYYKRNRYGIPYPIDSAFQSRYLTNDNQEHNMIFAGNYYYIYKRFRKVSGPHEYKGKTFDRSKFCNARLADKSSLNINLPGWAKVDAAMKWWRNNKVYLFTKKWYWRYDDQKKTFDCNYPRRISTHWRGLPERIDSAYSSAKDKVTFFTAGNYIYRFDDKLVRVKRGYPMNIHKDLLKCEDRGKHTREHT